MQQKKNTPFADRLLVWYDQHGRKLPWRKTQDPYCIWISEIILQQTRVNQGYDYYLRFIDRFPTIAQLASASEDEVLQQWQGLGYYSRARNLHKTAQLVMSRFGGVFPSTYEDILSLKGIGSYTAAAIASFAFDLPYAVVDGNVLRVFSRIYGIADPVDGVQGRKKIEQIASESISPSRPADYNQAIMDFGATLCTPKQARCADCPFGDVCQAYATNRVEVLPVKAGKTKVRSRYFNYVYMVENRQYTYLQKRGTNDIWQGLYQFPLIETADALLTAEELTQHEVFRAWVGNSAYTLSPLVCERKHQLSHQTIVARFFTVSIEKALPTLTAYERVALQQLNAYPISRLMEWFLQEEKQAKLF